MGSFCPGHQDIRTGFQVVDYIFGTFFIAYAIIYSIIVNRDFKQNNDNFTPGAKAAQISFCAALYGKGIGTFLTAITISANWMFDSISLFTNGLPGYIIAAAYCFIFFSWCSVCIQSFANEAKGFFVHSQKVLGGLLIFICLGFLIAMILMMSLTDKSASFHRAEAVIASLRDLIICCAFGFYLYNVQKLFDTKCCDFSKPESKLFYMCIILMLALFFRCISIQIYTWHYSNATGNQHECEGIYLANFIIDQFISEIIPLVFIGLQRCWNVPTANQRNIPLETTIDEEI